MCWAMQVFATLIAITGAVVAWLIFSRHGRFFERLHTDFFVVYGGCIL